MADPVWPSSLPQFPIDSGYSEEPEDNVLRSPTDIGPGKSRRRYTAVTVKTGYSVVMDGAQVTTFTTWWTDTLFDGAIPFQHTHPRAGTAVRFRPVAPFKLEHYSGADYLVTLFLKVVP